MGFLSLEGHPKGRPTDWFARNTHPNGRRSTEGYYLLNGCGVDPHLGLSPTDALAACALLDLQITMHISIEGSGLNQYVFNATVDPAMSYELAIGFNTKGYASAWQLYSQVIAVQLQPAVNFSASEIYGIVDAYDPVAGLVSGRVPIYVYAQLNFTRRCDVLLYGVCPNGAITDIEYEVRINMLNNKAFMKQVFYRPEEIARGVGIDARTYMNDLAIYSTANADWFRIWQDPASNQGIPSRPLSSPRCKHYDS